MIEQKIQFLLLLFIFALLNKKTLTFAVLKFPKAKTFAKTDQKYKKCESALINYNFNRTIARK